MYVHVNQPVSTAQEISGTLIKNSTSRGGYLKTWNSMTKKSILESLLTSKYKKYISI